MGKTKDIKKEPKRKPKPALSPEAREKQLISLAYDLAEEHLLNGTATSQEITHFLKLGSPKAKVEQDILVKQKDLITAKTEAIQSAKRIEELYSNAMEAMKRYSGEFNNADEDL